ncbi:MAG: glycoside hydrolase family 3 C-terminal domain-containing protein [Ruminococcus flavefaciens]|nr:glycoside hydrolase family 3 C-terminal domain-containing protein [Ruminococcus flavefaciens]
MNGSYMDAALSPEMRAKLLLEEMSLEEKMAQVSCVFPFQDSFDDRDWFRKNAPLGIGEVSTLDVRMKKTLEEAADWLRESQRIVMENSPHHIPAIFHMEGLCGAFIQEATSFPSGIGRGSGWDPELEEKIARIVSRQEAACGITHVLAPVLDISRDSRMGRQGESYGEDPVLAAVLGAAYTKGVQETETAGRRPESVAKHFLAFQNSQGGIHGTHSSTTERELREIYAKPFQAAVSRAGLRGVMPCYCSIDGIPVSVSHEILTGLLREEMGFEGLCVSDYGGIGNAHEVQRIGETAADAGLMAMEAGMDIEMPDTNGFCRELAERFADGSADIGILNRAVLRVLEAKFRMGLFEHPFALSGEELKAAFSQPEDREVSLQSARESMVLLKNDGTLPICGKALSILNKGKELLSVPEEGEGLPAVLDKCKEPLPASEEGKEPLKIALIGPHANSGRKFFGGYTHVCMVESTFAVANSIAGVAGSPNLDNREVAVVPGTNIQSDETEELDEILRRQKPGCRTLLEQLKVELPDAEILYAYGYPVAGDDTSGFAEALKLVEQADLVLLTLGGKHGTCSLASMGEGVDASDINLPVCQDAFIREAAKYGKPMVGIHFNGRPISSDAADQYLNAILEAWNPSECGAQAVTDVLLGIYNPGGKLPVSVAYHAGQIPVYYNHPNGSAWHQAGSIGFVNYVDLPHTPRYCFGHGLSYTDFKYGDLKLSGSRVSPEEKLQVSFTVTNTGDRAGDEVAQLYLADRFASRTRPVKELAGFKRIGLQPGESKEICFELDPSQTAFLDKDMRWKVEKGMFDLTVGSSSEDIRLTAKFEIVQDAWVEGKDRELYAEAVVLP